MPPQLITASGFLTSPTAEGQTVGAVTGDKETTSQPKFNLVDECPDALIKINECPIPFVLDTGSQVTLLSKCLFKKHLGQTGLTKAEILWLVLILYVGYAVVDCMVGSIHVPGKGVIIVNDEGLGPNKDIFAMNIIKPVWSVLTQTAFKTIMSPTAGQVWD